LLVVCLSRGPKQSGSPLIPVVRPGGSPSSNNKQAAQSAHLTTRTPLVSSGHGLCAVRSLINNTARSSSHTRFTLSLVAMAGTVALLPWISPVVGCVGVCMPCCLSPLESASLSLMAGLSPTDCMHIDLRSVAPAHSSTVGLNRFADQQSASQQRAHHKQAHL
jgi:hypothetical protein